MRTAGTLRGRLAGLAGVLPALALAAGCFQGERVIKVNADGSGTITDTVKIGESAKGMMEGMKAADKSPEAEKKAKKEEKLKAKAAEMGATFVSAESKDGVDKYVFAFKDVTALKAASSPLVSEDETSKEDPLTFRFNKSGANRVLTVVMPKGKPAEGAEAKKKPSPEEIKMAVGMMKGMMAGLKMKTVVEVGGKLVSTSSPYAAGSQVTLMEIDFDQLDEAGLMKLAEADPSSPPSAEVLKGVKGIKANTGEVKIEFK